MSIFKSPLAWVYALLVAVLLTLLFQIFEPKLLSDKSIISDSLKAESVTSLTEEEIIRAAKNNKTLPDEDLPLPIPAQKLAKLIEKSEITTIGQEAETRSEELKLRMSEINAKLKSQGISGPSSDSVSKSNPVELNELTQRIEKLREHMESSQ